MADQANFPDIYIDESVSSGGVGSLADPYSDFSEINWSASGDNSITDWYAGAEDASVTINLKRGEEWREQMTVGASGSATYPIIIRPYGNGADPIINGADVFATWSDEGSNIWSISCADEPEQVFFDGTKGTIDGTPDAEFDWYWDTNELFVWCDNASGPDVEYTIVEADQRYWGIEIRPASYITIENIETKYFWDAGLNVEGDNSSNIIADGLTISYCANIGLYMDEVNTYEIKNCDVSYCANNGIGIWGSASNGCQNGTISDNTVHHLTNDGIVLHKSGADNIGANHIISGNTVNNCTEQGIDLDSGSNITVENNITHDNASGGVVGGPTVPNVVIRYHTSYDDGATTGAAYILAGTTVKLYYSIGYGASTIHQVTIVDGDSDGIEVYNNVFVQGTGAIFDIQNAGIENVTVKNNIIYGAANYQFMRFLGDAPDYATFDFDYNQFYYTDGDAKIYDGSAWKTLAEHQVAYSQETNSQEGDPKFVGVGGANFHLQSGSPCIDKGVGVGLTQDYDGNGVPSGSAPDMGAHEYSFASRIIMIT